MAPGVLVQSCRLHGHGHLRRGRAQRFDLAPVRTAFVRPVIADLQHPGRDACRVGAKGQEDPDQVRVPAALEHLAGESERRLASGRAAAILLALRLTDQARGNVGHGRAIAPDHRHVDPGGRFGDAAGDDVAAVRLHTGRERSDDCGLPRPRHVEQHVVGGELALFLERPPRHALVGSVPISLGCFGGRDDRRAGCGARGHVHDSRPISPFVQQVNGREVEIELRNGRVGQVACDRVEHVLLARPWTQHRGRHVPERSEQPVAVLEAGDEQPARKGRADQVRARLQEEVCRRRPAHGRQRIPAEHDEKSVRLVGAAERVGRDHVEFSCRGPRRDRFAQQRFPRRRRIVAIDARRRRHRRMRRDQLQAHALGRELVDRRGVEIAGEEQVGERDRQESPQLFGVGLGVTDGAGQERCQPPEPFEGRQQRRVVGRGQLHGRSRSRMFITGSVPT